MTNPTAARIMSLLLQRPGLRALLLGVLGAPAALAARSLDHDAIKSLRDAGKIVSLAAIIHDAERRYREGRVIEAELEDKKGALVYEIKFLDADNRVRELYYDAKTGELLIYEITEAGPDGKLQTKEYDARTGELIRTEDADADEIAPDRGR